MSLKDKIKDIGFTLNPERVKQKLYEMYEEKKGVSLNRKKEKEKC